MPRGTRDQRRDDDAGKTKKFGQQAGQETQSEDQQRTDADAAQHHQDNTQRSRQSRWLCPQDPGKT